MTEKRRDEVTASDVRAVSPRYKSAEFSDVGWALMRPKDPKVRNGGTQHELRSMVGCSQVSKPAKYTYDPLRGRIPLEGLVSNELESKNV